MWVFAPRLSLIIQDRDLHFFTQKKTETVVFFLGFFFSPNRMNMLTYGRGVLFLTGAWVSDEACTIELLSAVVHCRLHGQRKILEKEVLLWPLSGCIIFYGY